ncbi:hypothetical protein PG985_014689 [Apiospora marii]|uniref:C2H2-type domain-containing protein n=1 Tax=Apiospora marii TaxID=335849 RepID=A0ABR1R4F7_9PEZI
MSQPAIAAPGGTYTCNVCAKVCSSASALGNHKRVHSNNLTCDTCGQVFTRTDSVAAHKFAKHGINTPHVCHIEDCYRAGLGLNSHDLLVSHLQQRHNGATLQDNNNAAGQAPAGQAPAESESSADDYEEDSNLPEEEEEDRDVELPDVEEVENEDHRAEIAEIHESYKRQLETLVDEASQMSKEDLVARVRDILDAIP